MKNVLVALALSGVARGQASCLFVADVVLLLDLTFSYTSDLPIIRAGLPAYFDAMKTAYPGSRMGVVSFMDVPLPPFGSLTDVCTEIQHPLTESTSEIAAAMADLRIGNGHDTPEAQLMAIQLASLNPAIGWRPVGSTGPNGAPVHQILVLVTDAPYHTAGNEAVGMIPNNGDGILDCSNAGGEDYPTLMQVKEAMNAIDAMFGGMITGDDVLLVYKEMLSNTIGARRSTVVPLAEDSSDFTYALNSAMQNIAVAICGGAAEPTTTVGPGSTTPPPTCAEQHALEMVFIEDLSYSSADVLDEKKLVIPQAFGELQSRYPNTKMALVTYSDKPVEPFGFAMALDFCFWLHHPLDANIGVFEQQYQRLTLRSGNDWKDDPMDAIYQVATDSTVGFTTALTDAAGRSVHRAIVVAADSAPHFAGDGMAFGLTPHDGTAGLDCANVDYPSSAQVSLALAMLGQGPTTVAFAIPSYMSATYAAIAAQWAAYGVLVKVFADDDVVAAAQEAIAFATDPCGLAPPQAGRELLEAATRRLSAPPADPRVALQPPIRHTLEAVMRGMAQGGSLGD